jgi:alpha-tubulin suppressor-like RCC1 family protein
MRRRGVLRLLNGTCIDDGANYFGRGDGTLCVKGLGHRGQCGDGRLAASPDFTTTAGEAVAMQAYTGHANYLRRDGVVLGTGGNGYGQLSSHDLGDKADRWAPIIDGARAIAIGSYHSLAIRDDASLWGWGRVLSSSRACGLRLCSTPRPATAPRWRSTAKAGDGYGMAAARCAG